MIKTKDGLGSTMDDQLPGLFRDDDFRPARSHLDSSSVAIPSPSGFGIVPSQRIRQLIDEGTIASVTGISEEQIQPASLDLRLGRTAYRVRGSFLPGRRLSLKAQLPELQLHEFDISDGAVLERGFVYLVQLQESVKLPKSIAAVANPKSSTGRLDVFVRLITDHGEVFDYVEPGYRGPLYAEISPRSFSIKVREGSRLNQIRFRQLAPAHEKYHSFILNDTHLRNLHAESPLVDGDAIIRRGLHVRVQLATDSPTGVIGYRAKRHSGVVDVDRIGCYAVNEFWEPIFPQSNGRLILDPLEFYILASKEALHIPPKYAAEMVPIDPAMGEFRVHYAGFFDPGFGHAAAGGAGSRAVLEVRSHEVPFFLEDGQIVGRLVYETLSETPQHLYGQLLGSNYQSQGLKLSKHFISPNPDSSETLESRARGKRPKAKTASVPVSRRSTGATKKAAKPARRKR